jgi:ribonuclease-3 family protein
VEKKMNQLQPLGMTKQHLTKQPNELNPLLLAYIGDAVYEIYVRYHLVAKGIFRPHDLQMEATHFVSAVAQASVFRQIEPELTDNEQTIFKRGRNAKSGSVPKNTKVSEYRYSTGLEALVGYLYLSNEAERLQQLMELILEQIEEERDHEK